MSYGNFRASTGDLGFIDDAPKVAQRWDRDRFERMSRRGPDERELFRFEERDRFGPARRRREVEFEERVDRRGPDGRFEERGRSFEDHSERLPRRPPADFFLDRDGPSPAEIASRALTSYQRKSVAEHDFDPPARRPRRPQFIRRQSSLDTFDRRPLPRPGDKHRDEFKLPSNVPIPLPILKRSPSRRRSPSRHRSASRRRYREEDFEEIKYKDLEPDFEEDYRDVRIRRERSRRRRSVSRRRARSTHSSGSSSSSFEEVSPPRLPGKKGKTRVPKRLVRKQVVVESGYPFDEEEDFIIIRRALGKDQIDELIRISEHYKDNRTTYRVEETVTKEVEATLPLAPPPPPPVVAHPSHAPPRREIVEERIEERVEESNHIGGPLTVMVPERNRRTDREIKEEIRALEVERRLLKLEREQDAEYEIIERKERPRDVVRVERDRKGRLALVRSSH